MGKNGYTQNKGTYLNQRVLLEVFEKTCLSTAYVSLYCHLKYEGVVCQLLL